MFILVHLSMNVRVDLYCTEFILRMRMCVVVSSLVSSCISRFHIHMHSRVEILRSEETTVQRTNNEVSNNIKLSNISTTVQYQTRCVRNLGTCADIPQVIVVELNCLPLASPWLDIYNISDIFQRFFFAFAISICNERFFLRSRNCFFKDSMAVCVFSDRSTTDRVDISNSLGHSHSSTLGSKARSKNSSPETAGTT